MFEKIKKIKKLSIYDPQAVTALSVFLNGPRTSLRKMVILSFNLLYHFGKKAKKYKHRKDFYRNQQLVETCWPKLDCAPKNHVAVIIAELSIPQCKMYRVDNKKIILENLGYTVYIIDWHEQSEAISYLQIADYVIFYRVPYTSIVADYYKEADRLHLTKFYDIDDLIFDIPLYKKYLKQAKIKLNHLELKQLLEGAQYYREAILHADVFLTSTKQILDVYNSINEQKKSFLLQNGMVKDIFKFRTTKKNFTKKDIRIFYGAGSNTHDADFDMIHLAISDILKRYPNVHLYVIGQLTLNPVFMQYKNQIHRISRLSAKNYFREIAKYDIALMPLTDTFFNNCKSNIKFIEASILNIPSIASNLIEFSNVIEDGKNGFLAKNNYNEWYTKIEKLVLDKDLRNELAKNALQSCTALYGIQKQTKTMEEILRKCEIPSINHDKKNNSQLNILQVNLYFGLNSLGGATIVVENIAEEMAKLENTTANVSIFTIHQSDSAGIGTLRKYKSHGSMVYSCSANLNEFTEIDNPIIDDAFRLILETVKPDVVHLHAVQGFGYGIGKICSENNIPYVMTLHDSWALCPKLFMVDDEGNHCIQYGDSIDICENRCHLNADWIATRRNYLFKLLKNAAQLYVPSFYAQKTMQKLIPAFQYLVNKNGIEHFEGKKYRDPREKIKFLFVAGEAEVKGFNLIHQALMELLDYDWELVLLMPFGSSKTKWPKNRIKILGRQNREQMKQLYKDIDVLLFPSLGYESFGLTVREAISSDCFVIVSDCGGPAEAVVNGENGTIVPRGNLEALKNAIEEILQNPSKYINYKTQNYGDIRSYKEQAEELIEMYDKLL